MKTNDLLALLLALGFSGSSSSDGNNSGGDDKDTTAPVFVSDTKVSVAKYHLSAITLKATDASTLSYSISETDASFFNVDEKKGGYF